MLYVMIGNYWTRYCDPEKLRISWQLLCCVCLWLCTDGLYPYCLGVFHWNRVEEYENG